MSNNKGDKRFNAVLNKKLSLGVSVLALAATGLMTPVHAQDDGAESADNGDEIVIRGIRKSLENAQDIKQNADTFVDSITASDIGALPDRSVLEALQRVPGVSISRFQGANDPDHFSVEGSGQVIRGLDRTRSSFNGRDAFSANNGRELGFNNIPPELVGGVDVYKNQTADMIEGGISGVINLRTLLPFDNEGQKAVLSVEGIYTDLREEWAPSYTGLYSNRWDTDFGEIGFLGSYTNAELESRSDGFQIGAPYPYAGIGPAGEDVGVFPAANIRTQDFSREREGISLAGQWANHENTMLATAQFISSSSTETWIEHTLIAEEDPAFRAGLTVSDLTVSPFSTEITTDRDNNTLVPIDALFTSGLLTSSAESWHGRYGVRMTAFTRVADTVSDTDDYSFNFKYTPNDQWKFNFDGQLVKSETRNDDISAFGAQYLDIRLDAAGETVEYLINQNPGNNGGFADAMGPQTSTTDPQGTYFRAAMDHFERSEGEERAFRADGEYDFADDGWFTSLRFGARYAEREQINRWSLYNWGNISEAWNGGERRFSDIDPSRYEAFTFDNFHRGGILIGNDSFLFPAVSLVQDYDALVDFRNSSEVPSANWQARGLRAPGDLFDPGEISNTTETTMAYYARVDFGSDDLGNGVSLDGNFGLRYVSTAVDAVGFRTFDEVDPGPVRTFLETNGQQYLAYLDQADGDQSQKSTFDNLLPTLNLKFGLNDEMIIRAAVGKSIWRPSTGNLRAAQVVTSSNTLTGGNGSPITAVSYDNITVQGGNPSLRPEESINYDLSYEWYFDDVGSFTASLFYKDLDNVIINGQQTLDQLTLDGQTVNVDFFGAVNSGSGNVQGFELAYQQTYDNLPGWMSGLGLQANYTYVDADVPNNGTDEVRPDGTKEFGAKFVVSDKELLSEHTVNLVGFYENEKMEARLAYNWRSDFLLTTADVITRHPVYNEATGRLDASLRYYLNDNFSVQVQGENLTSEVTETTLQIDEAGSRTLRSLFETDRRFAISASYEF